MKLLQVLLDVQKKRPVTRFELRKKNFLVLSIVLAATSLSARADEGAVSAGGLAFGDIYHIPQHHLPEGDGATGAVLRRGYLTANFHPDNNWFGRARIEVNQSGEFETYEFEADFKDLYVGYRFENHEIMAGLQPTLTFDVVESVWDMRYLMRTPADLQGSPSRDTGFTLKGRLTDSLSYRLLWGTGADFGAETGDGNSVMVAVKWQINDRWLMDFYAGHEHRPGETNQTTGQVFAGYETEKTRFGAQYFYRDQQTDPKLEFASLFYTSQFRNALKFVGRIDRVFSPSIKGNNISYIPFDPTAPATMYVAGLEYRFNDHFYLTPNTIVISYDENDQGERPTTDFFLRLTMFVNFE